MEFGTIVQAVLLVGFISIIAMFEKRSRRKRKLLKKYGVSPVIRFKNKLRVKGVTKSIEAIKGKIQPKDMAEYSSIAKLYWMIVGLIVLLLAFVVVVAVLYNMRLV
ncbi:MAG: hypothetical protein ACJAZ2_002124 [Glaciecola sp.]|jgi:hypothetical protein